VDKKEENYKKPTWNIWRFLLKNFLWSKIHWNHVLPFWILGPKLFISQFHLQWHMRGKAQEDHNNASSYLGYYLDILKYLKNKSNDVKSKNNEYNWHPVEWRIIKTFQGGAPSAFLALDVLDQMAEILMRPNGKHSSRPIWYFGLMMCFWRSSNYF